MSFLLEVIIAIALVAILILFMNRDLNGWGNDAPEIKLLPADDPMRINSHRQFYDLISRDQDTIIFVGAPWCGYCQQAIKPFMEAAKGFHGKAFVLEVKGKELTSLVEDIGVKGFPTILKSHRDGTRSIFTGTRSEGAFREYLGEEPEQQEDHAVKAVPATNSADEPEAEPTEEPADEQLVVGVPPGASLTEPIDADNSDVVTPHLVLVFVVPTEHTNGPLQFVFADQKDSPSVIESPDGHTV